jgi:hypothetical protein
VGDHSDPHVSAVLAATRAKAHVIDAASFGLRPITITRERLEDVRQLVTATRGCIRRLAPASWTESLDANTLTAAERAAGLSALTAVLHDERIDWLTPVQRLGAAENKPYQYRRAASVNVPVPEWIITTDPSRAPEDDGWVTKPLGPGAFMAPPRFELGVKLDLVDVSTGVRDRRAGLAGGE